MTVSGQSNDAVNLSPESGSLKFSENRLCQTPQASAAYSDCHAEPAPAIWPQRNHRKSVKRSWNHHQKKEWPGEVAVIAATSASVYLAGHTHPAERRHPGQRLGKLSIPIASSIAALGKSQAITHRMIRLDLLLFALNDSAF